MSRIAPLPKLDSTSYDRSILHAEDRVWIEKNCYVDIWIEMLHALALNPIAVLPFTIAIDFEGDQWTFYKPPHDELRELYGIDVQELNVWRPLLDHAVEHLSAGKLISTEADAFWLPDTAGTDYRHQHTKSTIVLADIDVQASRLGYFHNAGYYSLEDEDFRQLFRTDAAPDPAYMPLFAELVRIDQVVKRPEAELAAVSFRSLHRHLARVPRTNPIARFRQRFDSDLSVLQNRGMPYYHAWAFGTIRQLGSAFELAAINLRWLSSHGLSELEAAAREFEFISRGCKSLILKAARAVNAKRSLDIAGALEPLERSWQSGIAALGRDVRSISAAA